MLVLGPLASWKLWNTERALLLKAASLSKSTTEMVNQEWLQNAHATYSDIQTAEKIVGVNFDLVLPFQSRKLVYKAHPVHTCKHEFAPGSLVPLSSEVYCLNAPCLFLMLGRELDVVNTIRLGLRLCATYSKYGTQIDYSVPSATNVDMMLRYLDTCSHVYGVKHARRCAHYLADNIHSVAEEMLYLQLCLPKLLGGYALHGAIPNMPITLSRHNRFCTERFGDLCWPEYRICVEYDSTEYHGTYDDLPRDSIRRAEIMSHGFTVITITAKQLYNVELFRSVATLILNHAHKRFRYTPEFYQRQMDLRQALCKPFCLDM